MRMRKGIFQGSFPLAMNMQQCLDLTSQLGFDGIELTMESTEPLLGDAIGELDEEIQSIARSVGATGVREGALTLHSSTAEISEIASDAKRKGVQIHSIATMLLFFYPLSSPSRSVRGKGIEVVLKMIEAASILDASTVLVVPGLVTPSVGYNEVYYRSQDVLRILEPEARRFNVTLAIENVWNRFLLSPLEMARYVDEIRSTHVGVYLDVANVLAYGYPEDWLRTLGPRVKAVHFKDFRKDVGNILGFTHLFHGDVDWKAVMTALRDINYNGYVTVEVSPLQAHPLKGLQDARSSLALILDEMPLDAVPADTLRAG